MSKATGAWEIIREHHARPAARAFAHVYRIKRDGAFWALLVDQETRYKTRFEPGSESHADLDEMIICMEGNYWVRVGNWARTLAPGEMAVIPHGIAHDSGVATNLVGIRYLVLLFPKSSGILAGVSPGGCTLPVGALSWLRGAFRFLRHSPTAAGFLPLSVLPEFLRTSSGTASLPADASHPDPVVGEVLRLLEQAETPPLSELAGAVGLTPTHMQKRFRQAVGCSPLQYAHAWRLDAVASLLRAGSAAPLVDLATEHGFNDQKHFRTLFRRRFGMSPAAYRKNPPPQDA